jgi:hypothetical protein
VKTTDAQSEINDLNKKNSDLLIARSYFPITGVNCTWVVLTSRIIRNEKRIEVLSKDLGIRVGLSIL